MHIAQTARNTADKAGAALAAFAIIGFLPYSWSARLGAVWNVALAIACMFAVAAVARGASFSLLYRLLN